MNFLKTLLFIALAFNGKPCVAQSLKNPVEVVSEFANLYRYQNFFIAGQPSIEELQWLRSHGVKNIINLCTEEENKEVENTAYNEKAWSKKLGFTYKVIPVKGIKGYTRENFEEFAASIKKDEITLIHCKSSVRANDFFMAYLIEYMDNSVEDAISIGRQIRFILPLEKLLNTKLIISEH